MNELKENIAKHVEILCDRYPTLESVKKEIIEAYYLLADSYKNGGKLLVAGNGGSAADAEHIVGELMKGFKLPRKPDSDFADKLIKENEELGAVLAENLQGALPAIALDGHSALSTAYMNDCEPLLCFAQQVNGYGKAGDVFLGISTSGNSKNVLYAATTAHAKGMKVIGLTGAKNSKLGQMSDVCIKVPQTETYMIQELHLPVYHCLCLMLEDEFLGRRNKVINSKTEYYEYLEADRQANKKKKIHAHLFGDYTYNYLNLMRKLEYYTNCKSDIISKIYRKFLNARYKRLSVKQEFKLE